MADEKTYSESEHIAILSDRVTKETANLTAERDQLAAEKTELENKLDVETSAKQAAEVRATEAEGALEAFKTEVTEEREAAARKDTRIAKIREAASHLDDEFFADEDRIKRITAMADTDFDGYLADLTASSKTPTGQTKQVPRETAMSGQPAGSSTNTGAARGFLLRGFIAPTQEG